MANYPKEVGTTGHWPQGTVRLHPCGVVLNTASETPDQPTYSLPVAVSVKGFGHISSTERYILEIPLPFNKQLHPLKYKAKFTKKHLQNNLKHSIWHWSYLFAYYLSKALFFIYFPYHECFTLIMQLSNGCLFLISLANAHLIPFIINLYQKLLKNTHPHHTPK